jgi:hypothetical protein
VLTGITLVVFAIIALLLLCSGRGEHVHDEPRRSLPPRVDVDEVAQLSETGVNRLVARAKDESRWARPER